MATNAIWVDGPVVQSAVRLTGARFRPGSAVLEGGPLNIPCCYLDMVTRKAVCDLMVHRSGLNCRIIEGDEIAGGDVIRQM